MKNKLIILISVYLIASLSAYSQETLTYTDVVTVEGVSKDELYNRANLWFATSYNNSKAVLQLENKIEGQIIGKATMPYKPKIYNASERTIGKIDYTIKIFLKDNRYKYEITDFIHVPTGNSSFGGLSFGVITTAEKSPIQHSGQFKSWNDKVWSDIKSQIEQYIIPLVENLKIAMQQKAEIKNDDW